jgi:hypothetical protein
MSKLKSRLAYTWALLATPIVLATFLGIPFFAKGLVHATGVRISPWIVGGDVAREIEHPGYRAKLRRPVFDGLIGPRATGFVLVEWQPVAGATLPPRIQESVDYDGDGAADFTVDLDVAALRATLTAKSRRVLGIERVYDLKAERAVRVRLRRE